MNMFFSKEKGDCRSQGAQRTRSSHSIARLANHSLSWLESQTKGIHKYYLVEKWYLYIYNLHLLYIYISRRRSNSFCNGVMLHLSHDCERKIPLRRSMSYVLRDKFRNCREKGTFFLSGWGRKLVEFIYLYSLFHTETWNIKYTPENQSGGCMFPFETKICRYKGSAWQFQGCFFSGVQRNEE